MSNYLIPKYWISKLFDAEWITQTKAFSWCYQGTCKGGYVWNAYKMSRQSISFIDYVRISYCAWNTLKSCFHTCSGIFFSVKERMKLFWSHNSNEKGALC